MKKILGWILLVLLLFLVTALALYILIASGYNLIEAWGIFSIGVIVTVLIIVWVMYACYCIWGSQKEKPMNLPSVVFAIMQNEKEEEQKETEEN